MGVVKNFIVRAGADFSELENKMKTTGQKMQKFGGSMQKVGKGFTSAITVPAMAAAGGLAAIAISAGKTADELITTSNKTGLSTTALQELEYAARFVDVEVETMTDSMFKLTKNMDMARKGTGKQADAFKALGVKVTNTDGSLRDTKEVWADTIDALGSVGNESERDAMAYQLFGRSAQELNPLIKAGGDELKKLSQEAHDMGIIMGEDDVESLGKFDDSMERLKASLGGAKNQIAIALIPAIEKLIPVIQDKIVPAIMDFAGKIGDLIQRFIDLPTWQKKAAGAFAIFIVAIGPVLTVVGGMITTLGGLFKAFKGVGKIMKLVSIGPVGIIVLAIAGLALILINLWNTNEEFRDKVKAVWSAVSGFIGGFAKGIIDTIGGIIDKVKDVINWFKELLNLDGKSKNIEVSNNRNNRVVSGQGNRKIPAMANGGIVTRPTLALVGEAGPEAVIPLGKGMAMNHSGTIRVEGVNNKGELKAVDEIIIEKLRREMRR